MLNDNCVRTGQFGWKGLLSVFAALKIKVHGIFEDDGTLNYFCVKF